MTHIPLFKKSIEEEDEEALNVPPLRRQLIRRDQEVETPPEPGGLYFSSPKDNIQFIPSGCTVLDCVLGGGWALGRIANIVGDKATGKSLLCIEAIANFFRSYPDGQCWYNEAEAAFDVEYAEALGIPFDRVDYVEDCDTVEAFYRHLTENALKGKVPKLYILDSLDSLSDQAEKERGIDEATYGGTKAKQMSQLFRRITQDIKTSNTCLMVVSQTRDNIGVTFGEKHTRSGGRAMDFYASQILWLANTGSIKRTVNKVDRVTGVKIRAKCKKNKIGLPFRECDFQLLFGYGIDDEHASREFLKAAGKPLVGIDGERLSKAVVDEWYRIENTFLPKKKKYGD